MPDIAVELTSQAVDVTVDPGASIAVEVSPSASLGALPSRAGWTATNDSALPLGGLRILAQVGGSLVYADPMDAAHLGKPTGFASRVMQPSESLVLITQGEWSDPSWNFTPGATLYLAPSGLIAEAPTVGAAFDLIIGAAITATHIVIELQTPIRKA